jgi:hypothetical protein
MILRKMAAGNETGQALHKNGLRLSTKQGAVHTDLLPELPTGGEVPHRLIIPGCIISGGLRMANKFKGNLPGKPLVSVVTISFNSARTIERTISQAHKI